MYYPLKCLYIYITILLIITFLSLKKNKWTIDIVSFVLIFLSTGAVFSIFYFNVADGVIRNYSNISLPPFLYLIACYLVTLFPLYKFRQSGSEEILLDSRVTNTIKMLVAFLGVLSIEPFLENLLHLPNALGNDSYMGQMYDNRVDFYSSVGGKIHRVVTEFEFVMPVLLFYFLIPQNYDRRSIIFIGITIINIWMHGFELGGRSEFVQNVLYLVGVFFLMKKFLPNEVVRKVAFAGSAFIGVGILGIAIISILRFEYMGTGQMDIWGWIGLYAGEGPLNFNSMMWDTIKSTNGDNTLILPRYLLGYTSEASVPYLWSSTERIGIPGNIFYTYVGSFFADYKANAIIVLSILSILVYRVTRNKGASITLSKLICMSLFMRILMVPTFYTYSTFRSQEQLIISLLFTLYLSSLYSKKAY